ncbi:SusC/RagA family TonB-linked outer membrane protein [Pedobacter sp.]|uniref:SusC/RagA family TonB-linked outer membrane protein n=1 Tax=Pedobacter sp. TaxID=1411316 RepID=UPI0031D00F3D
MRNIYLTILLISCCPLLALGQLSFSGTTLSAADSTAVLSNIELTGADGKAHKTQADAKGRFLLILPAGTYRFTATAVGFKTYAISLSIPLKQPFVARLLPADNQLKEVTVSTGYQVLDRTRATGSFDRLDKARLDQQVGKNILERLEAIGNGLTFDRSTSATGKFSIRGTSTIRGPRDPLIVVDDFPYAGDMANINPEDVESITILKDAAAASIWGTRAGNGVVVITTKKGKKNTPLSVNFSGSVGLVQKPNLRYEQRISSADALEVEQFLYGKGYYTSLINATQKPALTPFVELLILHAAGQLPDADLLQAKAGFAAHDVYDDFNRYVYQTGFNQQYALALSGGSEKHAWLISSGYNHNTDNLDGQNARQNLRLNNSLTLLRNLNLNTVFSYTGGKVTAGRPGIGGITSTSSLYPYAAFADAAGNPLPITKNYRAAYLASPAVAQLLDWSYYPLLDDQYTDNVTRLTDLLAGLDLAYQLPLGFKASLKYNIEEQRTNREILQALGSYYTRNLINSFAQVGTGGAVSYPIPVGAILDRNEARLRSEQYRGQLDFNRAWAAHRLDALVGLEWRKARSTGASGRMYGLDTDKLTTGQVDYTRTFPNSVTGSAAYIPDGNGLSQSANNYFSQFVNVAYTFNNTYTLSASARADASNLFGVATNDKWKPLWSLGLGWDISKMPFFNLGFVDQLKLRSSLGFSGNADPSMSGVNTIRYQVNSPYTFSPYAIFDKYANPELRWETVRMLNVGLDFSVFKARLSGSVEYYQKHASDLFGVYPIDYTTGVGTTVLRNVAEIKGNGLDLQLNATNLQGSFTWGTTLNLSVYKDKVAKYYLPSVQGSNFLQADAVVSGVEGLPVYSIFSYRWAGLDGATGEPMGFLNGQPSKAYSSIISSTKLPDLVFHGSALPRYFGNMVNDFGYKGFTLSVALSFKFAYYFRRKGIDYSSLFASGRGHADYSNRWKAPGDEQFTQVPSMPYPVSGSRESFYRFAEVLIDKGDHIRIQYINLDYAFQKSLTKKIGLKTLHLFANLANVGIIYRANKHHLDPEYVTSGFNLPPGQTMAFGLRAGL